MTRTVLCSTGPIIVGKPDVCDLWEFMICQIDGSHVTRLLCRPGWGAACQLMGTYRKGSEIGLGLLSFLFGGRSHSSNSSSNLHVSGLQSILEKELTQLRFCGMAFLGRLRALIKIAWVCYHVAPSRTGGLF